MKLPTPSLVLRGLPLVALLAGVSARAEAQCQKQRVTSDTGWLVGFAGPACVATEGDVLVIGSTAPGPWPPFESHAYVFERSGGPWVPTAELASPVLGGGWGFGWAVALDGDTIAVGAPAEEVGGDEEAGSVTVFRKIGGAWVLEQQLVPPTAGPRHGFGWSLTLDADVLAVGEPMDSWTTTVTDPGQPGRVHVYTRVAGVWTLDASLAASDAVPGKLDRFGASVDLEGGRLVVGAPQDHSIPTDPGPGAVYVFEYDGSAWSEAAILHALPAISGQAFGTFVSLEGARLAVAEAEGIDYDRGAAYVFLEGGGTWVQEARLSPADQGVYNGFARTLALHDPYLLVGAWGDDDAAQSAGSAYVFERTAGDWQLRKKLFADDTDFGDYLGQAVAWNEASALVASDANAVYEFELDPACPAAAFTSDTQWGSAPFTVQFTDLSTGAVDEWSWAFGDGGTSAVQDPAYLYATPGEWTVSLVVRGPAGVDRGIEVGFITVESVAASVTLRNGFGINRQDYLDMGDLPVLGTDFTPVVAAMDLPNPLLAHVAASFRPHTGLPVPFGELLILPPLIARWNVPMPLGVVEVVIPIPNDLSLLGAEVSTQGGVTWSEQGRLRFELMNALDLVLGL